MTLVNLEELLLHYYILFTRKQKVETLTNFEATKMCHLRNFICCSPYSLEENQFSTLLKDNKENCWNLIENKYPKIWEVFHAGATDVLKQ